MSGRYWLPWSRKLPGDLSQLYRHMLPESVVRICWLAWEWFMCSEMWPIICLKYCSLIVQKYRWLDVNVVYRLVPGVLAYAPFVFIQVKLQTTNIMHYVHVCLLKICFFSALPLKNILLSVIYCHKSVMQQLPLGQAQQGSGSVRVHAV